MNDLSDIYENRIKSLTKDQFDTVVKAYIKTKWKIDDVIFTDGSHDGGVDLRIVENDKRKRIPIQVTIDKNTYPKLEKDLSKIERLIVEHNYSDTFYFFYSGNAAESNLNKLEDVAIGIGINLRIIDAKELGGIAESNPIIKNAINFYLNIKAENIFSNADKMQFDLLSFGSPTLEIKEKFAQALIINNLFEKGPTLIDTLKALIMQSFNVNDNGNFCEKQINILKTNRVIHSDPNNKSIILLSDDQLKTLNSLKENLDIEESQLVNEITLVLRKHKLEKLVKEILEKLLIFYKKNRSQDLNEIKRKVDENDFETITISDLRSSLLNNGLIKSNADILLKELLEVCSKNTLLQRISSSNLFFNLIDSPLLIAYINEQPKPIYLDTPILLHLICVFYNPYTSYSNIYYKIAKDFSIYTKKGDIKLKLYAIEGYIAEVAFQIDEAFLLLPFIEKDLYKAFGGKSNNVFYNFFTYLKESDNLESGIDTFSDFMKDFGFNYKSNSENTISNLIEEIKYLLSSNGIEICSTKNYKYDTYYRESYNALEKEVQEYYSYNNLNRSAKTLEHDLLMMLHLFDNDTHSIDPTLVTWDNTFFDIRKTYHKSHPNAAFWHLFRPAKLIDHFSLLRFKIVSSSLPHSVYSILETDYDINGKIKNLQATVLRIIDLNTLSGVKLAKELRELRTNSIYEVDSKIAGEMTKIETSPLDIIFFEISKHYFKHESKFHIKDLKRILNSETTVDSVINIIRAEMSSYSKSETISKDLFTKLDKLIENPTS